jgi:hypothetical protein
MRHLEEIYQREKEERTQCIQHTNPECEYNDICVDCFKKCLYGNKKDCPNWHDWRSFDLINLFKEIIDKDKRDNL